MSLPHGLVGVSRHSRCYRLLSNPTENRLHRELFVDAVDQPDQVHMLTNSRLKDDAGRPVPSA